MAQFDLFADLEPLAIEVAAPVRAFIPQPPAIIIEGQPWESGQAHLKPLRIFPDGWVETRLSDEEFAAGRREHGTEFSDDFVMLQQLKNKGVRVRLSPSDIKELYGWVEGQFMIRRRTVPGFTIVCWQGPAKPMQQMEELQ